MGTGSHSACYEEGECPKLPRRAAAVHADTTVSDGCGGAPRECLHAARACVAAGGARGGARARMRTRASVMHGACAGASDATGSLPRVLLIFE